MRQSSIGQPKQGGGKAERGKGSQIEEKLGVSTVTRDAETRRHSAGGGKSRSGASKKIRTFYRGL